MKTWISAVAWTCFMISAQANADTMIQLTNGSKEQLCIAVGQNPPTPHGNALEISGWTCLGQRQTLEIRFKDVRYLIIKDSSGHDYIARHPDRFTHDEGFAPVSSTNTAYGLKISAAFQGGLTYSYFFDNDEWSASLSATDFESLFTVLQSHGFKRVNAWKFNASSIPGGLGILLGDLN